MKRSFFINSGESFWPSKIIGTFQIKRTKSKLWNYLFILNNLTWIVKYVFLIIYNTRDITFHIWDLFYDFTSHSLFYWDWKRNLFWTFVESRLEILTSCYSKWVSPWGFRYSKQEGWGLFGFFAPPEKVGEK